MLRIESYLQHPLRVPLPTPAGFPQRFLDIPAVKADGEPGVKDVQELDTITIGRLRHHYDLRPTDPKTHAGKPFAELRRLAKELPSEFVDVGLLRIHDVQQEPEPRKASKAA